MTIRGYEKRNDLTVDANVPTDIYYTNFKNTVKRFFPMYGTTNRNDGDSNTLVITKPFVAYMVRKPSWNPVDVTGWNKMSPSGEFLGPTAGSIDIYEKHFNSGTHTFDNSAAYYLFVEGNTPIYFIIFIWDNVLIIYFLSSYLFALLAYFYHLIFKQTDARLDIDIRVAIKMMEIR